MGDFFFDLDFSNYSDYFLGKVFALVYKLV